MVGNTAVNVSEFIPALDPSADRDVVLSISKAEVLCMEVDSSNEADSEYRVRIGDQIKYILVDSGTFHGDILIFSPDLFNHLPKLPDGDWMRIRIFRQSGQLVAEPSTRVLDGIKTCWHHNLVDIRTLPVEGQFNIRVQVVKYQSKLAIAKIARFEFEIPQIENETAVYETIDGHNIGPAFLGHLTEHGRVIGSLLEMVEGRHADMGDLEPCQSVVRRLHSLGIVHGDLNKHNFIVGPSRTTLVDFEYAREDESEEARDEEFERLPVELADKTGRGCGFLPGGEYMTKV